MMVRQMIQRMSLKIYPKANQIFVTYIKKNPEDQQQEMLE